MEWRVATRTTAGSRVARDAIAPPSIARHPPHRARAHWATDSGSRRRADDAGESLRWVVRQAVTFDDAGAVAGAARALKTYMTNPMSRPAVRAPGFPDMLDWINTGGHTLTLQELRGRIVILDFWTYG